MKTLNDLKTELTATGYDYEIKNTGDDYFFISVSYSGQFGISNGYDIRTFNTTPLYSSEGILSFIAFTVKF